MEKKIEVEMLPAEKEKVHVHLNIEIIYVLDAKVRVCVRDKETELKKGDIFLINSNLQHSVELLSGSLACRFTLNYRSLSELLSRPSILYWCNSVDGDFSAYKSLSEILDALIGLTLIEPGSEYMQLSMYYRMVDCLEREFALNDRHRAVMNIAEDVTGFINMNYWKPLTLQDAADFVHMSYTAFSKYFKKCTGMTFIEYLNNIRMHFAVEELLYTDKSITNIAVEQGFSNPSVFNKNFRNSFHMTPTEYRQKYAVRESRRDKAHAGNGVLKQYFAQNKKSDSRVRTRHIYADSGAGRKYEKVWNRAVNVGAAANAYSSEMHKQMASARDCLGISYVRVCGLLDWDMKIRKGHETHNLNFDYVDRVLDTIVDLELIPFIELGDKTRSINYSIHRIWEEEREDVYLELSEFLAVVSAFLEHILHRYGAGAINRWIFELWFNNRKYERRDSTDYDYAQVFACLADMIKKYAPGSFVGGPGIVMRRIHRQLAELMPVWKRMKHPPDFISLYTYPYLGVEQDGCDEEVAFCNRTDFMKYQIDAWRQLAAKWGVEDIPVYITEYNVSLSQRNFYNDSNAKAAFLLKNMIDCLDDTAMGLYNSLSDLDSVYYDFVKPFSGVTGLLNKEGIPKPVFYAFKYMNALGSCLIDKGDGFIITSDGRDSFQILCCNYKQFNQRFFLREEYEIDMEALEGIFVDRRPENFHFVLKNLKDRAYVIKTHRVNLSYANVLESWKELGAGILDREEGRYLRDACLPKLTLRRQQTENGCLHLQETLAVHEIRMITIE